LSVTDASNNTLLKLRDLSTNFGAAVEAGAFINNTSIFEDEFNVNKTSIPVTADNVTGLGDSTAFAFDTFTGTSTSYNTPSNVVNGVGRFTFPATSGTGFVWASGRNVAAYHGTYLKANLPVVQMKVKPSSSAVTEDMRIGLFGTTTAASGTNDASPAEGIYFSNENSTTWTGVVRSGGANVGTIVCTGATISTTQFATLRIQVETSSLVRFLVDADASNGINFIDCGTVGVNTNPAGALTLGLMMVHTAAAASTFDVDYMRTWQDDASGLQIEDASPAEVTSNLAMLQTDDSVQQGLTIADTTQPLADEKPDRPASVANLVKFSETEIVSLTVLAQIESKGGLKVEKDAQFNGKTIFQLLAQFNGPATFRKQVSFDEQPVFSSDAGGTVLFKKGTQRAEVKFNQAYKLTPTVVASWAMDLNSVEEEASLFEADYKYIVTKVSPSGFTLQINKPAEQELKLSWLATAVKDAKISESLSVAP
jgi:hypothetical protein